MLVIYFVDRGAISIKLGLYVSGGVGIHFSLTAGL